MRPNDPNRSYVGNKMASLVMQALGCDVSAINTVYFSRQLLCVLAFDHGTKLKLVGNHTGYKRWNGRKVPAAEIQELYDGLKTCALNRFEMMLSGYIASKDAVEVVGSIARDLRSNSSAEPGSFFWLLDPVMGDEGRLYVSADIVPAYRSLLHDADLILPNAFEAELLSDVKIDSTNSLVAAITKLHKTYHVPHIIVTSVRISPEKAHEVNVDPELMVFGSSCKSDYTPRIFSITVPSIPVFFSGTGDMFAALTAVRHREAVANTSPSLLSTRSWRPPDDFSATELPLARATEKTLASMQKILTKTAQAREKELRDVISLDHRGQRIEDLSHERKVRASEVRVVNCMDDLRYPEADLQPAELLEAQAVPLDTKLHDA
ncbi:MAG: putative pyridoxal kinase [Chrysothrix sp. TS-e1954]|nr:MAG: putative pyridoxal kinase [Chrysothrix sp. TS-e1954]